MKKLSFAVIAILLGCVPLFTQDLVEAARKEQERRKSLKKPSAVVVTNSDLRRSEGEEVSIPSPPKIPVQGSRDMTSPQTSSSQIIPPARQKAAPNQMDQVDMGGFGQSFATKVLDFNELVQNPQLALGKPDGRFAEIPILGILDLEINAKNGPGDDIAIYVRRKGAQKMMPGGEEGEGLSSDQLVFGYWQGLWYGVLGMRERGDWVAIGQGTGVNRPEKFDIGSLPSIKKIRIFFKPNNNPEPVVKYPRGQLEESSFGIDAVEALHR